MKDFISLAKSEFRACFRHRTFMILLVAAPVVLNILFGSIFLPARTARHLPFAVWDQDGTKESRELIRFVRSNPAFDLRYLLADMEEGKRLLAQRKVRGFMIIPGGFARQLARQETADIVVYEDFTFVLPGRTIMKNLYKVETWYQDKHLHDYFQDKGVMDSASRFLASPTELRFHALFNPSIEYTHFILPGVLMAVLFQVMTLLGVTAFFMNREAYAGRSRFRFMAVKSVVLLLLFMIPFALTYGVFYPLFGLPQGDPLMMTGLFAAFALTCAWMGLAMAGATGDCVMATSMIIIFGAVGFTFSGYTWPYFLFPGLLKAAVYIFPITPFVEEIGKVIYGTGFPVHIWKMAAVAVAYLGLALVASGRKNSSGGRA